LRKPGKLNIPPHSQKKLTFQDARDLYSSWKDIGSLSDNDNRLTLRFKTMRKKQEFLQAVQKLELTEFQRESRMNARAHHHEMMSGKKTM